MSIPNPDSPLWGDYLSQAFAKLRRRAQPDPYATAHELAGAMVMPADFLPTRAMPRNPVRPDDELIPGRDDLEGE